MVSASFDKLVFLNRTCPLLGYPTYKRQFEEKQQEAEYELKIIKFVFVCFQLSTLFLIYIVDV